MSMAMGFKVCEARTFLNSAKAEYQVSLSKYRDARAEYKAVKIEARKMLVNLLPITGNGVTATELSEKTGLDTRFIASLLCHVPGGGSYKFAKTTVSIPFVRVNADGTIDEKHKIVKHYTVNTYRR